MQRRRQAPPHQASISSGAKPLVSGIRGRFSEDETIKELLSAITERDVLINHALRDDIDLSLAIIGRLRELKDEVSLRYIMVAATEKEVKEAAASALEHLKHRG